MGREVYVLEGEVSICIYRVSQREMCVKIEREVLLNEKKDRDKRRTQPPLPTQK